MTWMAGPLKYWLDENDSGTWGDEPTGDDDVVVLRSTEIGLDGSWRIDDPAMRSLSERDRCRKRLREGDLVVVTSSGSAQHLGKTAIVTPDVAALGPSFANFVQRLRPSRDADPRFVWYVLNSKTAADEMANLGNTTTGLRNLNGEIIGSITFPGPPLAEQRAIADYLGTETARIDALITKKRRMIELLDERRAFGAEEALSGLRLSCDLVPIKYLVRESDKRFGDGSDPLMLSVSIHEGVVPRSTMTDKESSAADYGNYKVCQPGDIAINRMRAFQGGVGVVRDLGVVSPDYTVLRIGSRLSPEYLHFVMRSSWFVGEMIKRLRGIGATDQGQVRTPRINFSDLGLIEIPVPTLEAQALLAKQLGAAESRTRRQVDLLQRQLELLAEHRQALITAAVTGELELSGVAT